MHSEGGSPLFRGQFQPPNQPSQTAKPEVKGRDRLSTKSGLDGNIARVRYVLPRHKGPTGATRAAKESPRGPQPVSFAAASQPRLPHDSPHAPSTDFRPRVHARPIRRQAPTGSPLPQALDFVARSDGYRRDVLGGLNERHIEQAGQPTAVLDLGAGPVGVVRAEPASYRAGSAWCRCPRSGPSGRGRADPRRTRRRTARPSRTPAGALRRRCTCRRRRRRSRGR